ncbi:hypothetical protein SAICODRAFT_29181 [Saitoella complicata NRRL Y-17804]|uniref:uncharacterized protein n=1 Tax=Saitoella complicata (strain BCRC 22490 / CBS 7301 / JCM 7358 / NBRC 10748 / NRRL Y-17804) TaxID=698492 RepID=UPI000867645D|nr:uncharacterized protein SAICODRAFT_29181 [Saitoella complicata NRRL Y-17804]ODQ54969.1 hypothetical protein SAICODRAFT_29181 [Saitoella complicata NRRL Y-17804]
MLRQHVLPAAFAVVELNAYLASLACLYQMLQYGYQGRAKPGTLGTRVKMELQNCVESRAKQCIGLPV